MKLTKEAYEKLFFELSSLLACNAYKIIKDWDEAKDIVQNCFIKLWQKREDYSTERARGVLFLAVYNEAIDFTRWQKKRRRAEKDIPAIFYEDEQPIEQPDRSQELYNAIAQLKNRQKRIFKAVFVEGLTATQAGKKLGMSQRNAVNVKSALISRLRHIILGIPDIVLETQRRLTKASEIRLGKQKPHAPKAKAEKPPTLPKKPKKKKPKGRPVHAFEKLSFPPGQRFVIEKCSCGAISKRYSKIRYYLGHKGKWTTVAPPHQQIKNQ